MLKQPGRGKKHVCRRAVEAGAQPLLDIRESTRDPTKVACGREESLRCHVVSRGTPRLGELGGALTRREVLLELLHGVCMGQTQLGGGKEKQNVYVIHLGGI